ncbi:uncharacterized protein LOC128266126 [Drosophila gunungcola]|uniref:uncharacterized protein LOC128266126 n=1 Tax=Drosophila gunungcola TaxID=103775 RepID=UPI0022E61A2A|nr:uncharacterized protein LOC128266126 [Drosophila gunungcola]
MFQASLCFLCLLIVEGLRFGLDKYKISLVSFDQSNKTGVWDVSSMRLIGRERLLNGTATLHEDLDDTHWSFLTELYSDFARDGHYKPLPFNTPQSSVCEAYKNYRKYFSKQAKFGKQTDFPLDRDLCPIPKGTYFFKDIALNANDFPTTMQRGYVRGNGSFFYDNVHVGTYTWTLLLEDED